MESIRGKTAIVGIGEVPTGIYQERSFIEQAVAVGEMAIQDAGIAKEEIDTVIPIIAVANPVDNANLVCSWLVEEMGMGKTCKANFVCASGGSSSSNSLKTAMGMIASGLSRTVLVVHTDKLGTGLDMGAAIAQFAVVSMSQEYEIPYGFSQLALAGFLQQRYMYDTGTTERQIASVVETMRKWAALNPNAMLRELRTADDVLASKVISAPETVV